MIDLDDKFGFLQWRIVALTCNLVANGVALYAAVRFIRRDTHGWLLAAGLCVSALCVILLARPDTRPTGERRRTESD